MNSKRVCGNSPASAMRAVELAPPESSTRAGTVYASTAQQHFHRHHFQRLFVGGFQAGRADDAGIVRFLPKLDADAPVVARFEAGEAVLGAGRNQIVADGRLMPQEFIAHLHANGVFARVVGAGVAFTIAIEAGERIGAAGLESSAENVFDHFLNRVTLGAASGIIIEQRTYF